MRSNKSIFFALFMLLNMNLFAQKKSTTKEIKIYVNAYTGNDNATGSTTAPLKTLPEAAKRINKMTGEGSIIVTIASGTYGLTETATFNPVNWKFSKDKRLIIRAESLPNKTSWDPSNMPIVVSTMPFKMEMNDKKLITGGSNYGIEINTSHVTIQGLRIMGEPVHENPKKGVLMRNYPLVWEGKDLTDLRVTQCLFLGNKFALPNHLGILANGSELNVDHCVFFGVKDAVMMWQSKAEKSSMHHNLILNIYGAAVWTWSTAEDFKFYNNVISSANVVWMLDKEEKNSFSIENSLIYGYNQLVNKGGGPQDFGTPADPTKLKIGKNVRLNKEGMLEIEEDQTNRYYLQIKPGTMGADLGAGLFY